MKHADAAVLALLLAAASSAHAAEVVEVLPLTDRILMVHVDDGRVVHHTLGQPRTQERAMVDPLAAEAASRAEAWRVTSVDDTAFGEAGVTPQRVARKSKGTEFAWIVENWDQATNRAINTSPDHAKEHWIYLTLPQPMQRGKRYTLRVETDLNLDGPREREIAFDEKALRSEAVHVNLLGHAPAAPEKFGYVYHWLGDAGGLDVVPLEGAAFHLIDLASGTYAFTGKLAPRKKADNPETLQVTNSPPHGNFLGADVLEADFSSFDKPGEYALMVEGVGRSWPFRIDADAYREAHRATMRALYHNRSGIALEEPYTTFTRPAPGHPKLTPGFAGKLQYTTLRFKDWGSEGGKEEELRKHFKGALDDAWGWYQDAGDWDGYETHFRVAQDLLLAYDLSPRNFRDGDNDVPESGNGIPDLLDEAAWLPRWGHRLRQELMRKGWGTGGIGGRVSPDAFGPDEATLADGTKVGRGSWQDDRIYTVSGEDPWTTYRYAGAAAQLADALRRAGLSDPEGVDWGREASEAYAWAAKNTRDGDEDEALRVNRLYAAAALFRLTGDRAYERQAAADTADLTPTTGLYHEAVYGPYLYALTTAAGPEKVAPDAALHDKVRPAVLHNADLALEAADRRALRWAGKWDMPMLIGQQTTPWAMELALGHALLRESDPAKARRCLAALYTTADYFLGTNALNHTWITGVGERHPTAMFHMDAWYNGGPGKPSKGYHEGLIPYSPWIKQKDLGQGPWDADWPNQTLHPAIDAWPGNERWFNNRCSPLAAEFTVHQNVAPAAAYYGLLAAPGIAGE